MFCIGLALPHAPLTLRGRLLSGLFFFFPSRCLFGSQFSIHKRFAPDISLHVAGQNCCVWLPSLRSAAPEFNRLELSDQAATTTLSFFALRTLPISFSRVTR